MYETGLEELVRRDVGYGRLHFATDLTSVLDGVEVVFFAMSTSPNEDGSADLKYVLAVARQFDQNIKKYTILMTKNTFPVDTAHKGIGADAGIGQKFLYVGCNYRDSYFPKDVKLLWVWNG